MLLLVNLLLLMLNKFYNISELFNVIQLRSAVVLNTYLQIGIKCVVYWVFPE